MGIGILTERDILNSLGLGQNPDTERAHAHTTTDVVFATPAWTLEDAASAMAHGGFRHLIVLDRAEPMRHRLGPRHHPLLGTGTAAGTGLDSSTGAIRPSDPSDWTKSKSGTSPKSHLFGNWSACC